MKFQKLILGLLVTVFSQSGYSLVKTQIESDGKVLVTFSGKDLADYRFIKNALVQANSVIPTKCFDVERRDEFGAPVLEQHCAMILQKGETVEFPESTTRLAHSPILQFKEASLIAGLRAGLVGSKPRVATVTVRRTVRRCTNTNSNPSCRNVDIDYPKFRSVAQVSAEDSSGGSVLCVDPLYESENLTALRGCYLVPAETQDSQKVLVENPRCDLEVIDEFVAFLKAGESQSNLYRLFKGERRENYSLRSYGESPSVHERKVDSFAPFHTELLDYEFYGPGVKAGDVTCQQEPNTVSLDPSVRITCTNNSSQDLRVGRSYRHGSQVQLGACNFFDPNK